ncbi:MAG: hypothetical protein CVU06_07555 [Bacteroidetes bacterium HGW-Bacteroidetes-22]|nr:MAG: hypothetical protein CVU06_07555 [Bacteroidetes bacterium HGW-Bacteroidetes-22]
MKDKLRYNPGDSGLPLSPKANPLRVPDGYFEAFDQRVHERISARKKDRHLYIAVVTAAAAMLAGIGILFLPGLRNDVPESEIIVASDTANTITGSRLVDQILADDIIEMAANSDTLFLDAGLNWGDMGLKEVSDETITEYLLIEGVSTLEIAMTNDY